MRETIPGTTVSSAYMKIANQSDSPLALVSVASSISKRIELHQHLMEDGMMKMRQVEKITIAPNSEVELKPSSYHIMIFALAERLKAGDHIPLTLSFSNGAQVDVILPVSSIKKKAAVHHHHH